ncbi:MAG: phosphoribosylaminoimidazolesuccinocarboxamide synthase [Planctomycetes bacterium]|nr:phosphoribosylaminoimidazolesuccinocarboxamide synthase [Planctomycetota bacterium]
MTPTLVYETQFPGLNLRNRGKVRDIYDLGDKLLLVATDRLSAFDVVNPTPIPFKGQVLTALSYFWFDFLRSETSNQLVHEPLRTAVAGYDRFAAELDGRATLVVKADPAPIECVVRGYLAGSGWKEYRQSGQVCGIPLPEGLRESEQLPEPIFTPATKAQSGHDENISFARMVERVGPSAAEELRARSLRIYRKAAEYARGRGILIADTKFEFGRHRGEWILIDEVLTPDSSRFWPLAGYQPGRSQPSFDKQFVRDYLETLNWNKRPPAPALPPEIVRKTSEKYLEALRLLTGKSLA